MNLAVGSLVLVLSLICWAGQLLSAVAPKIAVRLGLADNEKEVDPVFYIDGRGEAIVDSFTTWTMIPASILLIMDNPAWVYFGLIGGGIYIYFGMRIILVRIMLSKRNVKIGSPTDVNIAYLFGTLWALSGLVFIILAINSEGV